MNRRVSFAVASVVAAAVTAAGTAVAADRKGDTAPSEATLDLYRSKCQPCHMADGNAALEPMNFADGKWTHGSKPEEVAKVITEGVPTTAMLPFKAQLTAAEIADLAAYVRSFDKSLKAAKKTK